MQGIDAILAKVEIRATATSKGKPITEAELEDWGQLFDQLQEPFRTPAFRLLKEIKSHGTRIRSYDTGGAGPGSQKTADATAGSE